MSTALKLMTVDEFLLWAEGKGGTLGAARRRSGDDVVCGSRHDVARASGPRPHEVQTVTKALDRAVADGWLAL